MNTHATIKTHPQLLDTKVIHANHKHYANCRHYVSDIEQMVNDVERASVFGDNWRDPAVQEKTLRDNWDKLLKSCEMHGITYIMATDREIVSNDCRYAGGGPAMWEAYQYITDRPYKQRYSRDDFRRVDHLSGCGNNNQKQVDHMRFLFPEENFNFVWNVKTKRKLTSLKLRKQLGQYLVCSEPTKPTFM